MKLIRLILTLIMMLFTFVIVLTIAHGTVVVVTGPLTENRQLERPVIKKNDKGDLPISSGVIFIGDSIVDTVDYKAYKPNNYIRRTPWLSNFQWFQDSMIYLDYGVHFVVENFKSLFITSVQLDNLGEFYGVKNFEEISIKGYNGFSEENGKFYYTVVNVLENNEIERVRTEITTKTPRVVGNKKITVFDVRDAYNMWLRYNQPKYNKHYTAFYKEDGSINPATVLLYIEIVFSIIMTIYIVYQYPVNVLRDGNETLVSSSVFPKVPMPRKRNKRNKSRD